MRAWTAFRLLVTMAFGSFLLAPATTVLGAPPFYGATYAYVQGVDDPANFAGGRPVHVAALLPGNLACMVLGGARLDDPGPYPTVTNMLRAAPVVVTLVESSCPEPGEDRWLYFAIPHPVQADILDLVYVTPGGKPIAREKVIISEGTGGRFH